MVSFISAIPTVAIIESEMSLHAGQEKKVIAGTNNYSKSDSGKGPLTMATSHRTFRLYVK